ncbi:hypothetical protein ACWHA6_36355 [Streptomyces anthocyanicus]
MASLRVVKPGDEAPSKEVPATITEAIEGSARDVLASMRRALAKKLDAGEVSSNAIASAYKELRELDRQIRALDAAEEQEAGRDDGNRRPRRSFNASAL